METLLRLLPQGCNDADVTLRIGQRKEQLLAGPDVNLPGDGSSIQRCFKASLRSEQAEFVIPSTGPSKGTAGSDTNLLPCIKCGRQSQSRNPAREMRAVVRQSPITA